VVVCSTTHGVGPGLGDPGPHRVISNGRERLAERNATERLLGRLGEAAQAPARADRVAHAFPPVAMPVEVPVGQHDPGAAGRELGEGDLDLAGALRVGLDLPLEVDVPAETDPDGRFVGENRGPLALTAIGAAVDDVAAGIGLEDHLGQRGLQDVLVVVPPGADPFGEDAERMLRAGIDFDFGADRGGTGLRGHCAPPGGSGSGSSGSWPVPGRSAGVRVVISAARRKPSSERFQNASK